MYTSAVPGAHHVGDGQADVAHHTNQHQVVVQPQTTTSNDQPAVDPQPHDDACDDGKHNADDEHRCLIRSFLEGAGFKVASTWQLKCWGHLRVGEVVDHCSDRRGRAVRLSLSEYRFGHSMNVWTKSARAFLRRPEVGL